METFKSIVKIILIVFAIGFMVEIAGCDAQPDPHSQAGGY